MKMTQAEIDGKKRAILDALRPADEVNIEGVARAWPPTEWPMVVAYAAFRADQKGIFYDRRLRPNANWMATHSTQWFPGKGLFSMEPPRAAWFDVEKYIEDCVRNGSRISVNRYAPLLRAPGGDYRRLHEIPEYVAIAQRSAEALIGTPYGYRNLLQIAFNTLLGYPYDDKVGNFLHVKDRIVCSTAVRTNFEYLRKQTEAGSTSAAAVSGMLRLFDKMNRDFWTPGEYHGFDGVDVEQTCPAYYDNSKLFAGEFQTVARV